MLKFSRPQQIFLDWQHKGRIRPRPVSAACEYSPGIEAIVSIWASGTAKLSSTSAGLLALMTCTLLSCPVVVHNHTKDVNLLISVDSDKTLWCVCKYYNQIRYTWVSMSYIDCSISVPRSKNELTITLPIKFYFSLRCRQRLNSVFRVLILALLVSYKSYATLCNIS